MYALLDLPTEMKKETTKEEAVGLGRGAVSHDARPGSADATSASAQASFANSLPARGRPHRRGRARYSAAKASEEDAHATMSSATTTEARVVESTSGSYSTISKAVVKCADAPQPIRRLSRAGAKWQRLGWGEVSSGDPKWNEARISSNPPHPSAGGRITRLSPQSLLPSIALPAWCRCVSTVAYPLSEDGLTSELVDFFHYTMLTSKETTARERLLRCVEAGVEEMWGASAAETEPLERTTRVVLYGSYALGLSLPSSDIDLVLTFPAEEKQVSNGERLRTCEGDDVHSPDAVEAAGRRRHLHLERLHDLAEHLRRTHTHSLQVEVYDQCRVPRIHLRDTAADGVSCDINSSLTSDRVDCIVSRQQRWLKDSPLAAFLVRVTKAAISQWGLNKVFAGGLASTALYCLVLRFLAQAEQLHLHSQLVEGNSSPPRYDETVQSMPLWSTSSRCSPLPPSSPTTNSTPVGFPITSSNTTTTTTTPTSSAVGNVFSSVSAANAAAASIPSYVPSWALSRTRLTAVVPLPESSAGEKEKAATTTCGVTTDGRKECSLGHSHGTTTSSSSCSHRNTASSKHEGDSDDAEVDALTQEALTRTSCATTTSTTPTSRSATSTPPSSVLLCSAEALSSAPSTTAEPFPTPGALDRRRDAYASTQQTAPMAHITAQDYFPSAEELTRVAQARYGASPARLLLKLWNTLSADANLSGYHVADVFGDDAAWATRRSEVLPGKLSALPDIAALELATYASRSSADLSAPSFLLPDLLALFRCSSASLENTLRFQRYPRRMAPTMLSTIFVDPRMPH